MIESLWRSLWGWSCSRLSRTYMGEGLLCEERTEEADKRCVEYGPVGILQGLLDSGGRREVPENAANYLIALPGSDELD